MKRIDGFQCENCREIYNTAQEATNCEKDHSDRMAGAKITHGSFQKTEGVWGARVVMYPKSINVKFSEDHGDFARYVLEHVGYKGL